MDRSSSSRFQRLTLVFLPLLFCSVGLLLTGCAANVRRSSDGHAPLAIPGASTKRIVMNVTGSDISTSSTDWEQFKGEWWAAMKAVTSEVGLSYSARDEAPIRHSESGTLVVVYIDDYRYLSPGARYGFGIMTGNAYIESKVSFRDLQTGEPYGERSYNTSSTAWEGVFSAMTEKQVRAVCEAIVGEIKSHVEPVQLDKGTSKFEISSAAPTSARTHAVFGVELITLAVTAFGVDGFTGAMVKKVAPHSVAADAGIQVGDILLRVGDAGVNEPSDVKTSVAAVTAGDVVPIKLMRKATLIWVDAQF
jgi:hypothetical protein